MLPRQLLAVILGLILSAVAYPVAAAQPPGVNPTPPPSPSASPASRPYVFNAPVSGIGAYLGGNDQATSFDLPLIRTDSTYDTVIHVVNATSAATSVTIVLYDQSGNAWPTSVTEASLNGWASLDYDPQVDPNIGGGFSGTATVVASSPVTVTCEVLNQATQANVNAYNEVPGNSTVPSNGTNVAYVPIIPSCYPEGSPGCPGFYVEPTLYLHDTASTSATANLSFYWTNPPTPSPTPVSTSVAVPALGETSVNVGQVSGISGNNFDAATMIQSSQPLDVAVDDNGDGASFWAQAPTSTEQGTTFYVPRFEFNTGGSSKWITGLVLLNVAAQPQTFTVTVYNEDGSQALQMQLPNVPPMGIAKFNYGGVNQNLNLPVGFVGSAVVTSQASAVAWLAKYNASFSAQLDYYLPTAPPTGASVLVPAVRKNAVVIARQPGSTASTGLAIENPQPTAETYSIDFRDVSGNLTATETLTFPPGAMWYVSQATDPNLPNGFSGSAQVINANGGPLPVVAAEVDGGNFAPEPSLPPPSNPPTASPTPTTTSSATITPTTSAPTITATVTPTASATSTATGCGPATTTPTSSPTNSVTATATPTSSPTPSVTPVGFTTDTATITPTNTPTTSSPTPTPSDTPTVSPTPSATPTIASVGTPSSTLTATGTPTSTPSVTVTATSTASSTSTSTLTSTATSTSTATATPSSLASGVASYYKLDEGSGTSVGDSAGSNPGTWRGTLGNQWAPGIIGSAGNFDGTDNYVDLGNVPVPAAMSVSVWIYPGAIVPGNDYLIFSKTHNEFDLRILRGSVENVQAIYAGVVVADAGLDFAQPANQNRWYHYVFIADPTAQRLNLYRDGAKVASVPLTTTITPTNIHAWIGRNAQWNFGSFLGRIDELGVWDRAISPAEVAQLYDNGAGLQYPFTPTSSPTSTSTPTASPSATPTSSPTNSATATAAPTGTSTNTPTPTVSPTPSATVTPTTTNVSARPKRRDTS